MKYLELDNGKSLDNHNDSFILNLEKNIDSLSGLKLKDPTSVQIETALYTMHIYTDWNLND